MFKVTHVLLQYRDIRRVTEYLRWGDGGLFDAWLVTSGEIVEYLKKLEEAQP